MRNSVSDGRFGALYSDGSLRLATTKEVVSSTRTGTCRLISILIQVGQVERQDKVPFGALTWRTTVRHVEMDI